MKISKKIPRWYKCDSTYNTKKDAEERISELKKESKRMDDKMVARIKKRNDRFFSVYIYITPTQKPTNP